MQEYFTFQPDNTVSACKRTGTPRPTKPMYAKYDIECTDGYKDTKF